MRKILLVLSFILLGLDATHAASSSSWPVAASFRTTYPKPHLRFKEKKGTMGFIYGVVLGPVGYFGVKVFSRHNELMCYQAGRGFKIWGLLVASCLILAGCAALGNNSDPSNLLDALWANP
jgi:hypothetical protein